MSNFRLTIFAVTLMNAWADHRRIYTLSSGSNLQQLHDLSDAETVEALAFNMAWHYALDVRSEADSYFCEKTLRNYRRLFIEQGLDELLFRCLTDRLVQGFSVDTSHQRMDSTALRSAMRALTRLGIVVESISKFARELERYHPGLHEQISKEEIRRYVDREGNGRSRIRRRVFQNAASAKRVRIS